jgi:dynein heavy chain
MFKTNTEKIDAKCVEIASKLLININKKKAYLISEFQQEQERHRRDVLQKLKSIFEEIFNILCATYEPFVNCRRETQLVWFNYLKQIDHKIEEALKKSVKNSLMELYRVIGDPDKGVQAIPVFILEVGLEQNEKLSYTPTISTLIGIITNTISSMNEVVQELKMMQQRMVVVYKQKKV